MPSTAFGRRADLSGAFCIFDRSLVVVAADAARPMEEGVRAVGVDVILTRALTKRGRIGLCGIWSLSVR